MNSYTFSSSYARRLNRKAQRRVFLSLVIPWVGGFAFVAAYVLMALVGGL